MILRNLSIVVVCLVFALIAISADAQQWSFRQAALVQGQQDLRPTANAAQLQGTAKPTANAKPKKITKVKQYPRIVKCKPQALCGDVYGGGYGTKYWPFGPVPQCVLPVPRPKGWELGAQAYFARVKGHVRYARGLYGGYGLLTGWGEDVDLNDDLKVPEHAVVPEFTAAYRFKPRWSMRYSIMPMVMEQSGNPNRQFVFGSHNYNTSDTVKVKWERTLQRVGLIYDPVNTYMSRISVYGDYVRLDDTLSVVGTMIFGGDRMDTDLNMAMAGLELEKCLKTGRLWNTLSLLCNAGVAFGDDAVGSDFQTALKYSIPLGNGRWGYVKGGYRYMTYKKKSSDVRMMDTAMEGGTLQMGLVF